MGNSALPDEEQRSATIVSFVLRGSGRLDVSTSAYDSATPITVRVRGAEIRSVRPCSTRGGGGLVPPSQVRDNKLEIGPGLIGRDQILTYTLFAVITNRSISPGQLVPSGRAPVALTNALIDTKLRTDKKDLLIRLAAVVLAAAFIFGVWYGWLRHTSLHIHGDPLALTTLIVAVVTLTWTAFNDHRYRADPPADSIARQVRIILQDQDKLPDQEPPDQE
jgi:hypothetical protein